MGLFDFVFRKNPDITEMMKDKDIEGLLKALTHRQTAIRETSAKALGILQNDKAITPLIASLDDQSKEVQMGAAEALSLFESSKIGNALSKVNNILREAQEDKEKKKAQERALKKANEEEMRKALKTEERAKVNQVRKIFEEFSVRPSERLINRLEALIEDSTDPNITTVILETFDFKTNNLGVFGLAIQSLGFVRDPRALETLMNKFDLLTNNSSSHPDPNLLPIFADHLQRAGLAIVNLIYNKRETSPKAIPYLMKIYGANIFPAEIKPNILFALSTFSDSHSEAREFFERETKELRRLIKNIILPKL